MDGILYLFIIIVLEFCGIWTVEQSTENIVHNNIFEFSYKRILVEDCSKEQNVWLKRN